MRFLLSTLLLLALLSVSTVFATERHRETRAAIGEAVKDGNFLNTDEQTENTVIGWKVRQHKRITSYYIISHQLISA